MSCQDCRGQLFAFQFAMTPREGRAEIESHLIGCRECLATYLSIKREAETAESTVPSEASRLRLRAEVARELGLGRMPRARRPWEKAFALGCATAAVSGALLLLHVVATSPVSGPHALQPHQTNGSSR
jgi:hypothetical protein